jgi:hypothetical protein
MVDICDSSTVERVNGDVDWVCDLQLNNCAGLVKDALDKRLLFALSGTNGGPPPHVLGHLDTNSAAIEIKNEVGRLTVADEWSAEFPVGQEMV